MLPNLVSLIPLHSPALLPTLHLSTALVYATGPPYPLISLPTLPSCSLRAPLWISPALFTALFTDCARIFLLLYMFQPVLWYGAVGQVPLRDFRISLMGHNTIKTEEEVVFFWLFWNLCLCLKKHWPPLDSIQMKQSEKGKKISLCLTRSQFRDLSSSW